MRVSLIWRLWTMLFLGVVLGMFISIRYLMPPSTEINIGRVKVKSRDNSTVRDLFTIKTPAEEVEAPGDPPGDPEEKPLTKREIRQEKRAARRNSE